MRIPNVKPPPNAILVGSRRPGEARAQAGDAGGCQRGVLCTTLINGDHCHGPAGRLNPAFLSLLRCCVAAQQPLVWSRSARRRPLSRCTVYIMPLQLLLAHPRPAASWLPEPPCPSSRCTSCVAAWRLQGRGTLQWTELGQASRRQVLRRAEYSREAGGGSSGGGPPGRGPSTSFPQQPWTENYRYPPQPAAAQPPRLPPTNGSGGGGPGGDGGGGLSNLTKAFIAGAFILGEGWRLRTWLPSSVVPLL